MPDTQRSTQAMYAVSCGEVEYAEALRWQSLLVAAREAGEIPDVVLTLTHPPVYTAGRRADVAAHVRRTPATRGIPLVHVDRGGDVTYHGPGQLVAYPIIRLAHAKAVRPYVEALERAVVGVARFYGVAATGATSRTGPSRSGKARRSAGDRGGGRPRTGVWVGDEKLAAIGVRVVGRITSHGLALNVHPDLSHFAGIVPCGIADAGVCSLASLGVQTSLSDVEARLVGELGDTLERRIDRATPADLALFAGAA